MKKVQYVGTVVAVKDGKASVQLKTDASCGQSPLCSRCTLFRPESRTIRVERGDLEEGDTVWVSVPACGEYLSTLVVFVLPVVLCVVGFVVGGQFELGGGARGTPTLIGGAVGLALAVLVAVLVNRRLTRARSYEVRRTNSGES